MKRQSSVWEKISANQATDMELISKIHKELIQLNSQNTNNPMRILAEDLNRRFSKKDIEMAKKHMKRCSTVLLIKEAQVKTTAKYLLNSSQHSDHQIFYK